MIDHAIVKKMAECFLLLACGMDAVAAANEPQQVDGFYVANWNLENLFDTQDDPENPFDNEFLPQNKKYKYSKKRLQKKLTNLARVIQDMNGGRGPDILGFEEVEHEALIQRLVTNIPDMPYGIAYAESSDRRGIDVGLIYNKHLFELLDVQLYPVKLGKNRHTRDILHARLRDARDNELHVFVNHWPSRSGGVMKSRFNRYQAAEALLRAVDQVFERDGGAHVIVLGDFNDMPSDRSLRKVLQVKPYPSVASDCQPNALYNLATAITGEPPGSYFHAWRGNKEWKLYDQIIISGSLVNGGPIRFDGAFTVIAPDYMRYKGGKNKGAPLPTYGKHSRYLGGYSDHFPVGARFIYK